jgi:hypothetical protein
MVPCHRRFAGNVTFWIERTSRTSNKEYHLMPSNKLPLLLSTALLVGATAAQAAPPEVGPVATVVTNTESNPVPVQIQPPPLTILCTLSIGSGGTSSGPFIGFGSAGIPQTSVICPYGIAGVNVTRIGYSPDVGGSDTFNVTSYRVAFGYDADRTDDERWPAAGILGILSENVPVMEIMQPFVLDASDSDPLFYVEANFSSGFETKAPKAGGTIFLIGIPMN